MSTASETWIRLAYFPSQRHQSCVTCKWNHIVHCSGCHSERMDGLSNKGHPWTWNGKEYTQELKDEYFKRRSEYFEHQRVIRRRQVSMKGR